MRHYVRWNLPVLYSRAGCIVKRVSLHSGVIHTGLQTEFSGSYYRSVLLGRRQCARGTALTCPTPKWDGKWTGFDVAQIRVNLLRVFQPGVARAENGIRVLI